MWVEALATLFSVLGVYLTTKRIIWCWPISILAVLLTSIVYYEAKLYAEMSLQAYYLFAAVLGWIGWSKNQKLEGRIPVLKFPAKFKGLLIIAIVLSTAIMGWLFERYTSSDLPYIDSAIASASIVATWMMVKRFIEHWLLWIVIDSSCVILYLYKDLFWFSALFVAYTLLAIIGYKEWKKE